MNAILGHLRGFIALFLLVMVLLQMIPSDRLKKYIRFFAEMVLTFGFLYPVLSMVGDSDAFLAQIQYEAFTEQLAQLSQDTQKLEFLQNDYYIEKYEAAIGTDVTRIAEQYGYTVAEVEVTLTETYEMEHITLTLEGSVEKITVGEIVLDEEKGKVVQTQSEEAYKALKNELCTYYQIAETQIEIR